MTRLPITDPPPLPIRGATYHEMHLEEDKWYRQSILALRDGDPADFYRVMSSPYLFEVGRLMPVGAGGWGSTAQARTRTYGLAGEFASQILFDGVSSTPSDKPTAGRSHVGLRMAGNETRAFDMLAQVGGGNRDAEAGRIWAGISYDGVRLPWLRILHDKNMATPEGVVWSGYSGSRGWWIRFADGSQLCRMLVNTSTAGPVSWLFPAAFSSDPQCFGTRDNSQNPGIVGVGVVDGLSANVSLWGITGSRLALTVPVLAIGRWK